LWRPLPLSLSFLADQRPLGKNPAWRLAAFPRWGRSVRLQTAQ